MEKLFEKKGIYPEFCDGEAIVFYLSPCVKLRRLKQLKKTLTKLFGIYSDFDKNNTQQTPAPFVLDKTVKTEWVEIEKSVGRICANACGLFPPCTPLIYAGEEITEEKIKLLVSANHRFGVVDGKISVVKDGNDNANENG